MVVVCVVYLFTIISTDFDSKRCRMAKFTRPMVSIYARLDRRNGYCCKLIEQWAEYFCLGLASSVPLLLHLSLAFFSWVGLLNIGQSTTIDLIFKIDNWNFGFYRNLDWLITPFPMGFRGIEPMHGNLGYAACQAIALFGVSFGVAWRDRDRSMLIKAGLAIVICFSSILVAYSRGAVVYALFILVFLIYLFVFKCKLKRVPGISVKKKSFSILPFFLGGGCDFFNRYHCI